ncbi:MAG TPA: DUF6159 family protein [Humisphaera sp.]|jgi:hypothetical protein|nr:DUF6159 family protein [Humisphaera sp.]
MFTKIGYTWDLMKASWDVLKKDKSLLLFPLLSGISCLIVLASFALPIWFSGAVQASRQNGGALHLQAIHYIVLFVFYFCNYFVITFFNVAMVACALERMSGGEPTVGFGFGAAASKLPAIAGWSLVSATVGMILRLIEERSNFIGSLVAGLLGSAWTLVSYLAVPVMVAEGLGPIAALKESGRLLKKTWGEQLISSFGFGLIFGLLSIPGFALIFGGIAGGAAMHSWTLAVGLVLLGILYLLTLALINSALQVIFQAAVYRFAREGQTVAGFPVILLQNAMAVK